MFETLVFRLSEMIVILSCTRTQKDSNCIVNPDLLHSRNPSRKTKEKICELAEHGWCLNENWGDKKERKKVLKDTISIDCWQLFSSRGGIQGVQWTFDLCRSILWWEDQTVLGKESFNDSMTAGKAIQLLLWFHGVWHLAKMPQPLRIKFYV